MCLFLSNTLRKFACCKVNWDSSVKICVPAYKNTAVGIMSSSTRYTLTVSHILCGKSLPFLHQLAPLSLFHRWDYWSPYTANAEDWTLNIQEMRSHSGSRNAVCHGSHNLSWVVYSRLWLRKANAHQCENLSQSGLLSGFTLQANKQIPLILQSKTIIIYVYLKHHMQTKHHIQTQKLWYC